MTISSPVRRVLLWIPPLIFLVGFFFVPLTRILSLGLGSNAWTEDNLEHIPLVFGFTIYQATLSTVLTFLLGIPAAILFARYEFWGKLWLRVLTAVPFMLPTVVVAAAYHSMLSSRGWIHLFLPKLDFQFIGTLGAILVAHVFYNTTIVIRIVGTALARLDPAMEQAARSLGANSTRVWMHLLFPLMRPSMLAAALLVFLFDFTSFGVILLLGGMQFLTLEVEIYLRVLRIPDLPLASLLSIIQLGCTLLVSLAYTRALSIFRVQSAPRFSIARHPKTGLERAFAYSMVMLLVIFFLLPLVSLPIRSVSRLEADRGDRADVQSGITFEYYRELFNNRRGSLFHVPPFRAVFNSLGFAGITVLLSLGLGFPVAHALSHPSRLERFLDPLLLLPLGASAVMLGLGLILSFGRALLSPLFVPIAHTLVALPFVIRVLQPAINSIPERLRQAAAVLGASPWRVWWTVDWPILSRATLSAATFAFTVSLGEFGATLLLYRPEFPTLPVVIEGYLSQPGGLNYGQSMAMSTILMVLTLVCILTIEKIRLPGSDFS